MDQYPENAIFNVGTNEEVKKGIAKLITEKWSNYYAVIQAEQSYTE